METTEQNFITSILLKQVPEMKLRSNSGGWPDENDVKIHILDLEKDRVSFQIFFKIVHPNCCFGDTQSTQVNIYSATFKEDKILTFTLED